MDAPYYFFVPKDLSDAEEYKNGFGVKELFSVNSAGIVTSRDSLTIQHTKAELKRVIADFTSLSEDAARQKYNLREDVQDWAVAWAQDDLRSAELDDAKIQPIAYRPFDTRYTFYTGIPNGFHCRPRTEVMQHLVGKENVVLMCSRQVRAFPDWHHVFIADMIFESCLTSSQTSEISYGFPLYVYGMHGKRPNLDEAIVARVAAIIGREPEPLELFDYVYAVLNSPSYRDRYREFLKIDFPRIPYPSSAEEFDRLAAIGGRLRRLHLMEEVPPLATTFPVGGSGLVDSVRYTDGRVYINDRQYFGNVPQEAWEFCIGGYQPAQKWLKDRKGRVLSLEEIQHYEKIIAVLVATMEGGAA
jgi:predicted helicase